MSIIFKFFKIKSYSGEKAIHMLGGAPCLRDSLAKLIDDGKRYVYGINFFNHIIGRVCLATELEDKELADGERVCHLSHLYVNRHLRGRGIGTKLVNHVVDNAKKMGFKYLTLTVDAENEKNLCLYRKLGFNTCIKYCINTESANDKNDGTTSGEKLVALKKDLTEE